MPPVLKLTKTIVVYMRGPNWGKKLNRIEQWASDARNKELVIELVIS